MPYKSMENNPRGRPTKAVVIGIDTYLSPEYPVLHAAANDADSFCRFLVQKLHMPLANICNLRNRQATRDKIIEVLSHLSKAGAKNCPDNAPIIIYFAGHGTQCDGNMSALCSSDIGTRNEDNHIVEGITSTTLSRLLDRVAERRGNNITVFLDCCFSNGMRYIPARIKEPISSFPQSFLKPHEEYSSVAAFVKSSGQYTLITASGSQQSAHERKRGLFTTVLLRFLNSNDLKQHTYASLMHNLAFPYQLDQTPHCDGNNLYRLLFQDIPQGGDPSMVLAKSTKTDSIILYAGSAQGITPGSIVSLHKTNLSNLSLNPSMGAMKVINTNDFSSELGHMRTPSELYFPSEPSMFYSKVVYHHGRAQVSVYCQNRLWLESTFPQHLREALSLRLVDDMHICDLKLDVVGNRVTFERRNNSNVMPLVGPRLWKTVHVSQVETIRRVVKAFFHFEYHLGRSSREDFADVRMELIEIESSYSEDIIPMLGSSVKILSENVPNEVLPNKKFVMIVHNNSDLQLYPSLFYFDPMDLTIVSLYTPPIGAENSLTSALIDAPLMPRSRLAIGHKFGQGGRPLESYLPDGQDIDVGYLRLFLSTQPTSFDSILSNHSPFIPTASRGLGFSMTGVDDFEGDRWMVKTVPLIVKY